MRFLIQLEYTEMIKRMFRTYGVPKLSRPRTHEGSRGWPQKAEHEPRGRANQSKQDRNAPAACDVLHATGAAVVSMKHNT